MYPSPETTVHEQTETCLPQLRGISWLVVRALEADEAYCLNLMHLYHCLSDKRVVLYGRCLLLLVPFRYVDIYGGSPTRLATPSTALASVSGKAVLG
jgi:hypothetical protein